jgi:peptidoglycan/LPS O-acetylase OafA/YrhL
MMVSIADTRPPSPPDSSPNACAGPISQLSARREEIDRQAKPVRDRYVPELDGLRGLAILLVMLFHFVAIMPVGWSERSLACKIIGRIGASGWCGVDLFFVLSGFLITGILHDTRGSTRYLTTFYARRALRIFPLYYAVLLAVFFVYPWVLPRSAQMPGPPDQQWWYWLYCVNFLRALHGPSSCNTSGLSLEHFWSLAVEEQFYLIWPFVILAFNRLAARRACLILVGIAFVSRMIFVLRGDWCAAYMLTPCRIDALAAGSYTALVMRSGATQSMPRLARLGALGSGVILAAFVLRGHGFLLLGDPAVQIVGYPLLSVFFVSGVILAVSPSNTGIYKACLRSSFLAFFGKYSYGIYVYHFLLFGWLRRVLPIDALVTVVGPNVVAVLLYVLICATLSSAVAYLSWNLYERYFVVAKKFFTYSRPQTANVEDYHNK